MGRVRARWVAAAAWAGAAVAGTALAAIIGFLGLGVTSGPVGWWRLLTSGTWYPPDGLFGAAAMVWGTIAVSTIALVIAAPLGWAAAVGINEVVPRRARRFLRSAVELLAVVPSIVYGLIGIAYLRPFVARMADVPGGDSLLAAGLILAVMVLPTIVAVSTDALAAVPGTAREAAAALGLTRMEVIRSAVLPPARRGMRAALLLGLARAAGETVAVYLVVGRADDRLPRSIGDLAHLLARPGQTLTTKLNGPESVLAGTSGRHWAALCALGLLLLFLVGAVTVAGQRRRGEEAGSRAEDRTRRASLRCVRAGRGRRDRLGRGALTALVVLPLMALVAVMVAVVTRAGAAGHLSFWWSAGVGAGGGGIRDQLAGTVLLIVAAAALAAPVGFGLGLVVAEYAGPRASRCLHSLTLTLGGVPSILLGLWGYWLFSTRLGWGKSWLTGAIVLAVVALPPVVIATAAAAASLPDERREAALALGLTSDRVVRSVVARHALPGLVTGLLLGLARAAGETAPLLFTATVFSGAPLLPDGIRDTPVASLPTHIFVLAQDSLDPTAIRTAWGAALALIMVAGVLVLAAVPARRWNDRASV